MNLVEEIYGLTRGFPREETFALTAQMRRAAVSIPSNIAEGHARRHTKEYMNHLSIALGSLAELQTQIEIARRLGYGSEGIIPGLQETSTSLARQLHALRTALGARKTPFPSP